MSKKVGLIRRWLEQRREQRAVAAHYHDIGVRMRVFEGPLEAVRPVGGDRPCFGFSVARRNWTGFDRCEVDAGQKAIVFCMDEDVFALALPGVGGEEWAALERAWSLG